MSNHKPIDPNNIAAIYVDEEKKEQLIFTKDQLINQLQRVSAEIAKSFDIIYDEEFRHLSAELSFTLVKQYIGYKNVIAEKDDLRITCGDLLRNAANTIIAAISLLRNGFRLQSGILIRSAIEMCATVVHLLVEDKALNDFKNDKLSSTYSISVANKQVPIFGKAWGLLSKHQIHINSIHADWYPMVEYKDKEEIPATVILGVLGYSLLILDVVSEMVFIDEIENPTYWKVIKPGALQFIPPKVEITKWAEDLLKKIKN